MKKIIKHLILIPNLPFIIIISIYVVVNLHRHTGAVEMEFIEEDEDLLSNSSIRKYIEEIYPKHFRYFIAILFYLLIFLSKIN